MSDLRVGVAGIGAIAEEYLALFVRGKIKGGHVTALSSRSREKIHAAAQRFGLEDATLYTDYEEMLSSGEIDAVIICTPHAQHPAMAVQALSKGLHTLVEKPIGATRGEAKGILEEQRLHPGVGCGVLYCRRMNPIYRRVKELMEAGTVGKLNRACWQITNLYRTEAYHRSAAWRGSWAGESGGVLMTQASHQLDLLLWYTGLPQWVQGFCETRGRVIQVENEALLQMGFPNGATGQFIASSHEFPGINRLELSGDLGQILVQEDRELVVRRLSVPESQYAAESENLGGPIPYTETIERFPDNDNSVQQADLISDFLLSAAKGTPPVCPAEEALHSLAVINAAYLSAWKGGRELMSFDDGSYLSELKNRIMEA